MGLPSFGSNRSLLCMVRPGSAWRWTGVRIRKELLPRFDVAHRRQMRNQMDTYKKQKVNSDSPAAHLYFNFSGARWTLASGTSLPDDSLLGYALLIQDAVSAESLSLHRSSLRRTSPRAASLIHLLGTPTWGFMRTVRA